MYSKTPVRIPADCKKIVREYYPKTGDTYIGYTLDYSYDSEARMTKPKRKGIGKMVKDDKTMMYPNEHFFELFPDYAVSEEDTSGRLPCINFGTFVVFMKLLHESGLDKILTDVFEDKAGFAADLALYHLVSQNNVMQYYTNYAKGHPVFTKGQKTYSDSTVSSFLHDTGAECKDVEFQNAWTALKNNNGRIYFSYDSTNKKCESGKITFTEHGHPKKGEGNGRIINLSVGYDHVKKEPVFYELHSGSIVDISTLKAMIEKAKAYGFTYIGFIFDRGYFSRDNIEYLDKNNIPYIIMVKGLMPWVRELVEKHMGTFENDGTHRIKEKGVNGITCLEPVSHITNEPRYCHIYYSSERHTSEAKELDIRIQSLENSLEKLKNRGPVKTFNPKVYKDLFKLDVKKLKDGRYVLLGYSRKDEEIDRLYKLCGYFVIITSEEMSARDALITYKNRDEVEKLFRADKRFAKSERVASDESLHGKMLIEFIAMILYSKFTAALEEASMKSLKHPNYFTSTGAIQELEKITMVADPSHNYHVDFVLSKAQKEILDAFDIKYDSIRRHGEQISQILCKKETGELLPLAAKWYKTKPEKKAKNTT